MTAEHLPTTALQEQQGDQYVWNTQRYTWEWLKIVGCRGMHEPNNRESNVFKIKEFVLYLEPMEKH